MKPRKHIQLEYRSLGRIENIILNTVTLLTGHGIREKLEDAVRKSNTGRIGYMIWNEIANYNEET